MPRPQLHLSNLPQNGLRSEKQHTRHWRIEHGNEHMAVIWLVKPSSERNPTCLCSQGQQMGPRDNNDPWPQLIWLITQSRSFVTCYGCIRLWVHLSSRCIIAAWLRSYSCAMLIWVGYVLCVWSDIVTSVVMVVPSQFIPKL